MPDNTTPQEEGRDNENLIIATFVGIGFAITGVSIFVMYLSSASSIVFSSALVFALISAPCAARGSIILLERQVINALPRNEERNNGSNPRQHELLEVRTDPVNDQTQQAVLVDPRPQEPTREPGRQPRAAVRRLADATKYPETLTTTL